MISWKYSGQPRILIVDDNPSIHRDFDLVLLANEQNSDLEAEEQQIYGQSARTAPVRPVYILDHAYSGDEGIKMVQQALAKERPYQLAFVDIRMPGIDGIETIERIWRLDSFVQVVICTAFADYSWDDLARRLGPADNLLVLKKPFDAIEVTQLASTLTKKWFLGRQAALKIEQMELLVSQRTQRLLALQRQPQMGVDPAPENKAPRSPGGGAAETPAVMDRAAASSADQEAALADEPCLILVMGRSEAGCRQVRLSLEGGYRILEARDGEDAFRQAQENVPDLILAEVAGGNLDGIELCRRLKNDELVSHIPIIVLGPAEPENAQIQALEQGADDYIVRPFNEALLKARVDNLTRPRRQLRNYFGDAMALHPRDIAATQVDAQFFQRAMDVVEANLSDFEFDVDAFAKKMATSRRQLLRKFKGVAGCTPKFFIHTLRLKRAAQLLKDSQMTVSEVTYAVGYCDLKHFRAVFRKQFGVLPGEYAGRFEAPDAAGGNK